MKSTLEGRLYGQTIPYYMINADHSVSEPLKILPFQFPLKNIREVRVDNAQLVVKPPLIDLLKSQKPHLFGRQSPNTIAVLVPGIGMSFREQDLYGVYVWKSNKVSRYGLEAKLKDSS
mmetsp:Transcript_629/g.702  ORF Transcript_629/g.702 Transcript_629/m.702 type:complete len:118 (+) Transcript_629:418-771(+)